jgi:hypothetical protein
MQQKNFRSCSAKWRSGSKITVSVKNTSTQSPLTGSQNKTIFYVNTRSIYKTFVCEIFNQLKTMGHAKLFKSSMLPQQLSVPTVGQELDRRAENVLELVRGAAMQYRENARVLRVYI